MTFGNWKLEIGNWEGESERLLVTNSYLPITADRREA